MDVKDYIVIKSESIDSWKKDIAKNLIKTEGKLEFKLEGTDEDNRLIFTPHFQQHTQRYGIYWILVEDNSEAFLAYIVAKQHQELVKAAEIDSIQIGNDQYELSHQILGKDTESGDRDGYHYRFAKSNGWFSYELKICKEEDTYLQFRYMPGDCRESFLVFVNDVPLSTENRDNKSWREVTECTYLIPKELYSDKDTVTVKFLAQSQDNTGRIIELIKTTKK